MPTGSFSADGVHAPLADFSVIMHSVVVGSLIVTALFASATKAAVAALRDEPPVRWSTAFRRRLARSKCKSTDPRTGRPGDQPRAVRSCDRQLPMSR